ncbi:MAG: hypothetical protein ACP5E2_03790 [Terracidiphilus sp.]
MKASEPVNKEDRSKIAAKIVDLSGGVLSIAENPNYIALKAGRRLAATVRKNRDRVSVYILRTSELLDKARSEGFSPVEGPQKTQRDKDWFQFRGLTLSDIQAHESLFREIVHGSVSEALHLQRIKR